MVESVDTGDLKSPGRNTVPVRVRSPAPNHPGAAGAGAAKPPERAVIGASSQGVRRRRRRSEAAGEGAVKYRGVEQLAARRAHNPEDVGSSPAPANSQ